MRITASPSALRMAICVASVAALAVSGHSAPPPSRPQVRLAPSPADAVPVPADYNGDQVMDFALKGANGIWYIDVGVCSRAERERACSNDVDDDLDSAPTSLDNVSFADARINDGCPAIGPAETNCRDQVDDDDDGAINDGCPATGRYCQGLDGFGGRWDFAYAGYGDRSAIPVPADYGRVDGSVDPEHRADLAIKDGDSGMWAIDYADNGFGAWDVIVERYGNVSAVPVPADYDGDGRADLAIKGAAGEWLIDYAHNGFGAWDSPNAGCPNCSQLPEIYGGATWIPVPADYNGDGRADLAIKNELGQWKIDYSNAANTGFGAWDCELEHYGNASAVPVPFNYDPWRDKKADLAVKSAAGEWFIDYAVNDFGHWDEMCGGPSAPCSKPPVRGYGGDWSVAIPGDYDGDGTVELSVKATNGQWFLDRGTNGWFGWDVIPGTTSTTMIDNPHRPLVERAGPHIRAMTLRAPDGAIVAPHTVKIGVRYSVDMMIWRGNAPSPGTACTSSNQCAFPLRCERPVAGEPGTCKLLAGLEVNPDLSVPSALNVLNPIAATRHVPITGNHIRRFSFTCSEWGSFALGFMFRANDTLEPYNADYGLRLACTSVRRGLYGRVTVKAVGKPENNCADGADNDHDGLAEDGCPLAGATVTAGDFKTITASSANPAFRGTWHLPDANKGPYTVTVTKDGYAASVAVNVRVPGYPADSAGMQIDTPLEESFSALGALGISYRTYIDYSRGRTILHTVMLDATRAAVRLRRTPAADTVRYRRLLDVAIAQATPLVANATWWFIHDPQKIADDEAQGYFWSLGRMPVAPDLDSSSVNVWAAPYGSGSPIEPIGMLPMFGVSGSGPNQRFSILMTEANFLSPNSSTWKQTSEGPVYDVRPPFNRSDFTYAAQNSPILLLNGQVIARARTDDSGVPWDYALPRTAVATNANGTVAWLVIADGEGVHGSSGATLNQLGEFFRDVLHATAAMNFDGGESSELILRGTLGPRRINRLTSENNAAPPTYEPSGRVFNYLSAGQ